MTGWRVLDNARLLRAAEKLLSAPPLRVTPAHEAAEALGWTITNHRPRSNAFLDSGWGLGPYSAYFNIDREDRVTGVIANITEEIGDSGPQAEAFKQDTFATAANTLTEVYGPPTDRRPGKEPELWWRRDTVTLRLITTHDAIALQLTPTERLEEF